MRMIKEAMHKSRLLLILALKAIISIIPKKKDLILFSAWNGQRYADSSMYMYEYSLKKGSYEVYWFTKNKEVYDQLQAKGMPVVYSRSFKGVWKQLRAIMLVSSIQLADFNPYLLKNCIYYDLGHGFPIKESGFEQKDCTQHFINYTMTLRKGIKYYMPSSSEFSKDITCRAFKVELNQIAFCTFPRIDVFFDEKLREGINENIAQLIANKKVIAYLPTHRAMGKERIQCSEIFNLHDIQHICEEYDAIFLIKKHYFHSGEREKLEQYDRIIDITNENVETQTFLYNTDILVTDYSACSIDFSVLNRPMIFHAYDLEDFLQNERNLYVPFELNKAGIKTYTQNEFSQALRSILKNGNDDEHQSGREELRRRYFDDDCPIGHSREDIYNIMQQMIAGVYHNKWEE